MNTSNTSAMHNDIMVVGSKEHPLMLALGPCELTQITTPAVLANGDKQGQESSVEEETYDNTTPEARALIDAEVEVVHMIFNGIVNDIYSNIDACPNAKEMWIAIKYLKQGESFNKQDVKNKLFCEFCKFTSRNGELIEPYYTRFYKMVNEIVRNKLKVDTMQVNVQFLQQLQLDWSRFVTVVKQTSNLDTISYHTLFDILKQYHNEVNEILAERLARNANPLTLVAATQHYPYNYPQAPKTYQTQAPSPRQTTSTKSHATTRSKGKEITFKNIYKPTNNNLRTSSNTKNKNIDNSLRTDKRTGNDRQTRQYENERALKIVGNRKTVGTQVVQQTRIQCFNFKGIRNFANECRSSKWVKDYAYRKEKMLLFKKDDAGVQVSGEQSEWLHDTDDEPDGQELEAHYMLLGIEKRLCHLRCVV
ncbi:hypothetical protein Tco_0609158 [Tanacetum coccineum]